MARRRRTYAVRRWQDYVESILIAILLALVVRTFVLSGYRVPTSTMAPALKPGDFIFAFKPPFGLKIPLIQKKIAVDLPRRGDIVVFTFPDQPRVNYVKRVIGLPGDVVQIRGGKLEVSGQAYSYQAQDQGSITDIPGYDSLEVMSEVAPEGSRLIVSRKGSKPRDFGPILVPQGELFLLGDNRDASDDSRYWGTVPMTRVDGRVFLIWLSLDWSKKWGPQGWPSIRRDRTWTRLR